MKRIAAVVRPEKLEPLKEALFQAKISGMTIYQVHGCGNQHGWKEYFRGSEVFLNMIPKVKFEIIVEDSRVDEIVNVIVDVARTGEVGDGKIFISSIDSVVRVRTGEKDEAAV
jgi:nitrogen regulatory protein P-II 1